MFAPAATLAAVVGGPVPPLEPDPDVGRLPFLSVVSCGAKRSGGGVIL